jgi:hypothetical protein
MGKDDKRMAELISQITKSMDLLISDTSVPKNVRGAVSEARTKLNATGDYTVRISSAIYNIDAVSSDINLPPQARTVIWNILSMLESVKEQED